MLTEAGKKWVEKKIRPELEELFEQHALQTIPGMEEKIREARQDHADFWLRAFCETLESRVDAKIAINPEENWRSLFVDVFDELKRELLGD